MNKSISQIFKNPTFNDKNAKKIDKFFVFHNKDSL